MLKDIPTHLIAGPLGAGKTSLIRCLLEQKPAHERWAVLLNEFGQIGLDAALLERTAEGVELAEIAGGCLCCVNGLPFQVGLGKLLRQARPQRLLIEPSGLGHPGELLHQLAAAPWDAILALQPLVLVVDAAALAAGQALPASQQDVLATAGLLVLNKSEALDQAARQHLASRLPDTAQRWTSQAQLALAELPGIHRQAANPPGQKSQTMHMAPFVWLNPDQPVCQSHGSTEGWSIGWRWHPSQRFDCARLQDWLAELSWRRAKLVLHTGQGWCSANAVAGQAPEFKPSEWRRDSRLELIFEQPQVEAWLTARLAACRIA
ncbi:CobW family GTP-binding protein [Azomonas macrocytogenes]|uniref:G3E family GTPase n=1 Tax=Azomonas macrocytogenes TaxID=69962 RepID=A0A839T165_AZOMA|nr:GTP-binding protein [Azomonas macrocytogenes]MBB3103132.1 G3E family GTPase [Azomonas macrocytogenes]